MGMTEKESLINSLTIELAESYNINVKKLHAKIETILQDYHVTISDERFKGENLTTEYLMGKFKAAKLASGMSPKTLQQYEIAVMKVEQYTSKRLSDIECDDINHFFLEYSKKASDVTVRGKYHLLSSIYTYLYERKYIPYNPMALVDPPKVTIVYKKPLTEFSLEMIKKSCESIPVGKESVRDMALIHFFVSTGCRVSEVANIKIKDLDLTNHFCKVMGKGKKERVVVLTDRATYRIMEYLKTRKHNSPDEPLFARIRGTDEHPMTSDGISRIVEKLRNMTGESKLTCHTFRRYYATELRKRNVSVQMIAKSLGHANLGQINRYSLFSNNEMIEELRHAS